MEELKEKELEEINGGWWSKEDIGGFWNGVKCGWTDGENCSYK
jgi:bacteriocin-like protein